MNPSGLISPQLRFLLSKPFSLGFKQKDKNWCKGWERRRGRERGSFCRISREGRNRFHPFDSAPKWQRQERGSKKRIYPVSKRYSSQQKARDTQSYTRRLLVPGLQKAVALSPLLSPKRTNILHEICAVLRSDLQSYNYPGNSGLMFLKIPR